MTTDSHPRAEVPLYSLPDGAQFELPMTYSPPIPSKVLYHSQSGSVFVQFQMRVLGEDGEYLAATRTKREWWSGGVQVAPLDGAE